MKNLFHSGLVAFLAVFIVIGVGGCITTNSAPPTKEAVAYYAFTDTWAAARSAYEGYCELAVQGLVSQPDQRDIDAAWNQFRVGFKLALMASQRDWSATTPDAVVALKNDLITLIRSL
jgi:hypothetical protein